MQATLKVPNKKVIKRTQSVGAVEAVLKKAIFILAYRRYVASRAYIKTVRCRLSIRPSVCPRGSARGSSKAVHRQAMRIVGCRVNTGPTVRRTFLTCLLISQADKGFSTLSSIFL